MDEAWLGQGVVGVVLSVGSFGVLFTGLTPCQVLSPGQFSGSIVTAGGIHQWDQISTAK